MKKTYFLSALLWCLLALAACGKEIKETEDESRYFEIRGEEIGQLGETESGQFLLGQQYYHGEPVSLIAVPSESGETTGALDVYLCSMEGDKKLLMGGVSSQYRSRGWYLDEKERCFIIGMGAPGWMGTEIYFIAARCQTLLWICAVPRKAASSSWHSR